MWWGFGNGKIAPFVGQMLEWIEYYKPIVCALDSTATQKNTAEVMNMEYIFGKNLSVERITGLDFSGGRRWSYLVCLKLAIENRNLIWPKIISPIGSQLQNYDPQKDKGQLSKIAQDILVTLAMAAFTIRAKYGDLPTGEGEEENVSSEQAEFNRRSIRTHSIALRSRGRQSR
jgi:hypothetical protein